MTQNAATEILLVDDTAADAELTTYAIDRSGVDARVVWLCGGQAALNYLLLRAQSADSDCGLPALVLVDDDMPTMSGVSLLAAIRRHPNIARTRVIMLSSNDDPQLMRDCLDLGALAYVTKPIGFDEYVRQIQTILHYWLKASHDVEASVPRASAELAGR